MYQISNPAVLQLPREWQVRGHHVYRDSDNGVLASRLNRRLGPVGAAAPITISPTLQSVVWCRGLDLQGLGTSYL
jgi:hypothetical protein